jgi:hypothetical protein
VRPPEFTFAAIRAAIADPVTRGRSRAIDELESVMGGEDYKRALRERPDWIDSRLSDAVRNYLLTLVLIALVIAAPFVWFAPSLHGMAQRGLVFLGAFIGLWPTACMAVFVAECRILLTIGDGGSVVVEQLTKGRRPAVARLAALAVNGIAALIIALALHRGR